MSVPVAIMSTVTMPSDLRCDRRARLQAGGQFANGSTQAFFCAGRASTLVAGLAAILGATLMAGLMAALGVALVEAKGSTQVVPPLLFVADRRARAWGVRSAELIDS